MKKEIKKEFQCSKCGAKYQKIIYVCPQCGGIVLIKKQEKKALIGFYS